MSSYRTERSDLEIMRKGRGERRWPRYHSGEMLVRVKLEDGIVDS